MKKRNILIEISCFSFILVFCYAALSKMITYETFANQIGVSPLLTSIGFEKRWGFWLAWTIPAIEIGVSVMLMMDRYRFYGLCMATGIMTLFTLYILYVLNLAPYIPCTCGGILEKMDWITHAYFNLAFVVLGLSSIYFFHRDKQIPIPKSNLQGIG
ncbi:MAG: hypothetical protein KF763_15340 [Cyclobacteriaceae bacterium]|nr:hypothetical protein [Cyclobacteriaceae bacterium]